MPSIESSPISASPLAISALDIGKPSIVSAGRFALLLAIAISALFANVLFGGETFYYHDYGGFGYPLAKFHRECFWRGELPLWNPLNSCGIPFLAQWNTLTLYPLSLIYLLLPLPWSLSFFCLVHLFIAGMGMYFLARRWTHNPFAAAVAGTAFAFNGLTLHCLIWPNNIAGLAWMPWVLLALDYSWKNGQRWTIVSGIVAAIQLLTGAPEVIICTWMIAAGSLVLRAQSGEVSWGSSLRRGAITIVIASGLAAAQLLPFLKLLAHSDRSETYGAASWSMPIWGWVNIFFPLFRTFKDPAGVAYQEGQSWTNSYYAGVVVVFLGVLSLWRGRPRAAAIFGSIALIGMVFGLGERGYIYGWLYKMLPVVGFIRYPIKYLFLTSFALPLLAAWGTSTFGHGGGAAPKEPRFVILIWALFVSAIAGALAFAHWRPYGDWTWTELLRNGGSRILLLTLALVLVLLLRGDRYAKSSFAAQAALVVLIFIDGWTHLPRQNPAVTRTVYGPGVIANLVDAETLSGKYRAFAAKHVNDLLLHSSVTNALQQYIGSRAGLLGNCNLVDDVATPDGFYSMYPFEQRQIWSKLFFVPLPDFPAPLADFVGIRQISTNLFDWKIRPSALPLVTAGAKPVFIDKTNILRRISSPEFDPRKVVYIPSGTQTGLSATNGMGAVQAVSRTGSSIIVDLAAENGTNAVLLTVAESYDDGWRAFAGGQRLKLWRANHAFMAIEAPAGAQKVELVYRDDRFKWGMAISGSTAIGCIAAGFRYRKRLPADR
jgi:Bacterial membrane protein YfhO